MNHASNIYDAVKALYDKAGHPEGALQADLEYYLRNGYVFATSDYFILGQRIHAGWYIHAAIGTGALESFLRLMPYYLPYIGWERRGTGKVKWYPTTKFANKLLKGKHYEITKSPGPHSSTSPE